MLVNLLQPGLNLGIELPDAAASSGIAASGLSLQEFVGHLVPTSIADAMARNEILQIVVFSVFFGVACAGVGCVSMCHSSLEIVAAPARRLMPAAGAAHASGQVTDACRRVTIGTVGDIAGRLVGRQPSIAGRLAGRQPSVTVARLSTAS